MNRRFRALAFAAAGGLLLVAPATTAFAMSPIRFVLIPYEINLWADEAKANQMSLVDALQDVRSEALQRFVTQPIVNPTLWADSFHEAKAYRMSLVDELQDVRSEALQSFLTQPILNSTRYAGKQLPI